MDFSKKTLVELREIAKEKFESWQSVFGVNPKFNIERTGRFDGGKITFRLDVSKGVIKNASVFGDFFSTLDAETICSALIGCRYEKGDVLRALLSNGIDGAVYRISAEDMAKTIAD